MVDARSAERDARALVGELYETINRGHTDSLFALLGDALVVYGPRARDASVTRSDALVALGQVVDPRAKKHTPLRSLGLAVAASDGGRSAWAVDRLQFGGRSLAVTAVLSSANELWGVAAAQVAEVPAGRALKAEAARDAIVPPGGAGPAQLDAGAEAAVARFRAGLLVPRAWGDDLAASRDSVVVGPTGEVARGRAAIERLWKARESASVRLAISGAVRAETTPDGQLVWVSAPVTRVTGDEVLPMRAFAVYERAGAGWRMVALHEAIAIEAAGSGTAWKKVVPPEPPAAPSAAPTNTPSKDRPEAPRKKPKRPRKKPSPD